MVDYLLREVVIRKKRRSNSKNVDKLNLRSAGRTQYGMWTTTMVIFVRVKDGLPRSGRFYSHRRRANHVGINSLSRSKNTERLTDERFSEVEIATFIKMSNYVMTYGRRA